MRPRLSLSNRIALIFSAITFLAIGALYLYVAPGLQSRLATQKLGELANRATRLSAPIAATVGGTDTLRTIQTKVDQAALASGSRVTLLSVSEAVTPGGPQISTLADSTSASVAGHLGFTVARMAVLTHRQATGTEHTDAGEIAVAAEPVVYQGRVDRVIVYSAPFSDIVLGVATVRHQMLVAGAIALVLAAIGGYGVARALTRRVKRLELAATRIAAGDFDHPIRVGPRDELGQLAEAFNDMQRQLAALDQTRKRFIATASHELRTPIFSLGGFVELLEDDDLDPETRRRFLEQVRAQTERLRKLSVDLLDLSRLEAGSLELRPEEVDLGELIRSVAAEFEPALATHDSHLELRLPSRPVDAYCDPVRAAQVLRILLDNALTHTTAGTRIGVTCSSVNGRVRLAVRDDGSGIDSGAMERIFDPFYTADGARGSGLGLAIASELAEQMRGGLSARSEPGETVFTLELPA